MRVFEAAGLAVIAVAAMSCATMTVSSHVERGLDFGQYHTYRWTAPDALPADDPRLGQNSRFRDHMMGAVEKQLAARGFEHTASGTSDLLIHYHASVTRRIDVNRVDFEHGYCYEGNCAARTIEFEAGTIVLDIVDARTNRVIWRGWAQQNLDELLGSGDRMAKTIDEAVRRMLERFPVARISARSGTTGPGAG